MAYPLSSSPSDVTFSSEVWKYHVFLSFRGEDTRKTFVDHLYTALLQQGIFTYKDDETLPRGESIGPSLVTAIEESQIAIIIFSKNYADSSWCLDELERIMKCKDTRGQIVMPIFYDVDPSEVRKQKRKYGEAFVKHELENKTKVESWKKALVDASNISGWEPQHIANGHESKFIKKIVDIISHRLRPITSSVDDNLVGVEARMQDLISKLQIGFGGKRMIGIWGVGGGGKTTIASCIYDEISSKFDGCCFLKNIREESSNKNGLEKLQAEILCGILKQKQLHVGRVEEGRRMITDRLKYKKVLIVLDDVDNLEHLEELVGSRDWFGEGSRIIITTRDEHILTGHKVDVIHNISLLNNEESMKLFWKHAPRGYKRIEDYERLSKDVVSYAGGLPLALRVLSRFLCDKEMNEWRSALARLKEIPDANILEKLKISFDGLKTVEKQLFLDIACFFRRRCKNERIMAMLDACGLHPVIGIKVLVQKALITITEYGKFDMHDLVQEMAHYIVRGEHPNNPEKHSRLWKKEDVLKICAMDAMTNLDKIEAMYVLCSRSKEPQHVLQVAANMKKLRCIDLGFFLDKAELVIMPENFPPRELCCLTLEDINAKQLWEGYKYLPNLRMIKLDGLRSLIKTPDFDGIPNLERFIVEGSSLLEEIHPSFGRLEKLVCVHIQNCENLKMVPPITQSKKLETLVFSGCRSFNNFLPDNMNHTGVWFFSGCLRKLVLSNCSLGDGDISSAASWELPNLLELDLQENGFVRLDFSLLLLPQLKCLDIRYCKDLVELSELPLSIAVVLADGCFSLESFGDISNCKWLWKVTLTGNHKLGPLVCDMLLNSMLLGNAKHYFISINLSGIDIWSGPSVVWINWVKTCNMTLPHD
ncbi:TMV resistance protein N isoform X2 [Lactuca sativa]|nr:TMV resistance protein N isoform X2 [Lactuca sativa]